jgi:hypothetical protein
MKKLILAVLVVATFGVNAGALEKSKIGWTTSGGILVEHNDSLNLCRLTFLIKGFRANEFTGESNSLDVCSIIQKMKNKLEEYKKTNEIKEVAK